MHLKKLYYNYWPSACDWSIDFDENYYKDFNVLPAVQNRLSDFNQLRPNCSLFVKQDILIRSSYVRDEIKNLDFSIVLVSGVSSLSCHDTKNIANFRTLKAWLVTNPLILTPKVVPIPIGFQEESRHHPDFDYLMSTNHIAYKKSKLCSLTFHTSSFHKSRPYLIREFNKNPLVSPILEKLDYPAYIFALRDSYSTICLRGAGYDTHRIYESLCNKSVPIIDNNVSASILGFHELPYIFLDDFLAAGSKADQLILQKWHNIEWITVEKKLDCTYYASLIKAACSK